MIQLTNIQAKIREKILFSADEIFLEKGSLTAFIGKNGSGKSTLLKALAGFDSFVRGQIQINDAIYIFQKTHFTSSVVSYIPVKVQPFGMISVLDFILSGKAQQRNFMDVPSPSDIQDVLHLLSEFKLGAYAFEPFENLSDGEQKLVLILRAVFKNSEILLIDEPESFLDVGNRRQVFQWLKTMSHKGKTIVFSTHQPELAAEFADQFLWISKQKLALTKKGNLAELMQQVFPNK